MEEETKGLASQSNISAYLQEDGILPLIVTCDQIKFAKHSTQPGAEPQRRLKNLVSKSLANQSNKLLKDVCLEIATKALSATYTSGTNNTIEQFCAIAKKETYNFNDNYVLQNHGMYLELEVDNCEPAENLLVIIKHTYIDTEEEKESAKTVREQIAYQAVAFANYP